MDGTELLRDAPTWVGYVVVGTPGVWALVTRWLDARKDRTKQRADLIKIAQDAAASVIEDLRGEVDRLRKEVAALEGELNTARKEHTDSIAAKDAEIALLRGQVRAKEAAIAALERFIIANGLEPPHPVQPFFRVPPGDQPTDVEPL